MALAVSACGSGDGLRTLEMAVRTAMTQVGRSLLEKLLSTEDGRSGQWVDCGYGHLAEFVGYRDKGIDTVLGRVRVRRAYYHCRTCQRGVVPRDGDLGVDGASLSPGLRRMVARVAAVSPFAEGADLLDELAGVRLSTKRVERSAEADGQAAAAELERTSKAILAAGVSVLPPTPLPDKLYITVDGTGVPVVAAAALDRAGKSEDGRARTREVKLACLFTQTKLDDDGNPVRDPDTSIYVHTFDPVEQFTTLVHAEARRRGAEHIRQLVVLGDGAVWIWNLATKILPEATQIVDYYHAREHVNDLAKQLAPILGENQPAWLDARLADLDHGDIEALVKATTRTTDQRRRPRPDRHRPGLLHQERTTHALQRFPRPGHVHRLRRRRGRLQDPRRPTTQTLRHALEHPRRHRHPHPAQPPRKQPLGRDLATTQQPDQPLAGRHQPVHAPAAA